MTHFLDNSHHYTLSPSLASDYHVTRVYETNGTVDHRLSDLNSRLDNVLRRARSYSPVTHQRVYHSSIIEPVKYTAASHLHTIPVSTRSTVYTPTLTMASSPRVSTLYQSTVVPKSTEYTVVHHESALRKSAVIAPKVEEVVVSSPIVHRTVEVPRTTRVVEVPQTSVIRTKVIEVPQTPIVRTRVIEVPQTQVYYSTPIHHHHHHIDTYKSSVAPVSNLIAYKPKVEEKEFDFTRSYKRVIDVPAPSYYVPSEKYRNHKNFVQKKTKVVEDIHHHDVGVKHTSEAHVYEKVCGCGNEEVVSSCCCCHNLIANSRCY